MSPDHEVTVKTLVSDLRKLYPSDGNDDELVKRVKAAAKSEDDPPPLLQWDLGNLELFAQATGQLSGAVPASPLPPPAAGPGAAYTMQEVATGIIGLVVARTQSVPIMQDPENEGNGIIGVACNLAQFGGSTGVLASLGLDPWFAAVLAVLVAQNPNFGPLAAMYTLSMTRNPKGLCTRIMGGNGRLMKR